MLWNTDPAAKQPAPAKAGAYFVTRNRPIASTSNPEA